MRLGGELIFDDSQADLTLKCKYILIMDGGALRVGSEEKPYQNKATIQMIGHVQSVEIPLFGAKVGLLTRFSYFNIFYFRTFELNMKLTFLYSLIGFVLIAS